MFGSFTVVRVSIIQSKFIIKPNSSPLTHSAHFKFFFYPQLVQYIEPFFFDAINYLFALSSHSFFSHRFSFLFLCVVLHLQYQKFSTNCLFYFCCACFHHTHLPPNKQKNQNKIKFQKNSSHSVGFTKPWIQYEKPNNNNNNNLDPMEMSYLLGIAGGCFTALLLLVCLCIYAIRAKKCCFKGKFSHFVYCLFAPFKWTWRGNKKKRKKNRNKSDRERTNKKWGKNCIV